MASAPNNIASLPTRVLKRDGVEVAFDDARIESAILRAGQASGEYGDMDARLLTA
ncbi:ATP cone domain-containing protein [uncultured Thiodictyon sp.]|uniref:ATP cone domain-containing protein n=1 Tax=uncultured Thiodictyon sp. TaxID=1846217 RepID=UPI0025FCA4E2|nr:ATP cone domain-containing protein [uncultured Thiodictyon sp.]